MWVYNNGTNVVEVITHFNGTINLTSPLSVASGGTGAATLTGVVKGNGTSAFTTGSVNLTSEVTGTLPIANGGTGQTTYTNGQLLIGNTTGNTLTKATLTGTTDRIIVTNGTGSITLTADATNANTANKIVARDASGNFSAGIITASLSGNATTAGALNTGNNYQVNSFGVGTPASGTTGEIRATDNVTAYYSSDRKFKENIRDIDSPLEKVLAIGGKYFDWTDAYIAEHGGEDGYFVNKSDFGVIAQDVHAVFPVAVKTREDGSLAVDYEKLCSLAFAAIQELERRIAVLENK
jgi:hypothetical protein